MMIFLKRVVYVALIITILAGFAGHVQAADDLMGMYKGYAGDSQQALNLPHRSADEVGEWISEKVASYMSFKPGHNKALLASAQPSFNKKGFAAYLNFLKQAGFGNQITKNAFSLSAIVPKAPVLIGQGASGGRYAWAFEVPISISYPRSANGALGVTEQRLIRVQVGRAAKGAAPHGLLFESWVGVQTPAEK